MNALEEIVKFNVDRGLTQFRDEAEYAMLTEEMSELESALYLGDEHEIVDALCDIIVLATGAIYKLGYDPGEALEQTVLEITSRKGQFNQVTGKWEKDQNQDSSTLYKANYSKMR